MALQLEGSRRWDFSLKAAARGRALEREFILHDDAVVLHGEDRVIGLLAVGVKLGRRELDVVGLPLQRREAHIHLGRAVLVDAATFVIQALQAEAIEDLYFIAVLHIDAAVRAALATAKGLERQEEFQV